jgi:Ca-activated chloride channel family protein
MTFGEPLWFWAFALFPVLVALFFRNERLRTRTLQKLIAARLVDRLASTASIGKRRLRFVLLLLGLACVIVSMAQPRWGFTWQERKSRGRDVIIAIDTSRSMLANDLAPNRLTRAKLAAEDLIRQLPGDRVGLIAFAGSAFLQAPLTADHSAVVGALHELDTEIIPRGGTNIAAAIRQATEAFGKGESENRALVVFTDGEELDADGIDAAKSQEAIAKIYTIGVGSRDGTVIALPGGGGGFLTDPKGQIVKSRLDEERLQAIADAGGGFYLHLQNGPAEMQQLVREGLGYMSEKDIETDVSRLPIERYQWPLGVGMLMLCFSMLISERRRGPALQRPRAASPALASLAALLLAAMPAEANSPRAFYEEGRYGEAQKGYEELLRKNPESDRLAFNHGAAAYKNRDYGAALQAFGKALTTKDPQLRARAEYNLGNTLFQQALGGKKGPDIKGLESALTHFDQARKLEPKNEDAQYNYEATRKLIEELQRKQEQQQQQEKKDQEKQDKKDEEKKDQEKKDDQSKDQPKSGDEKKDDQQKQDQQKQDGEQDQQKQDKSGQDQEKKDGDSDEKKEGEQPKDDKQQGGDKDQEKKEDAGRKPDEEKQGGEQGDKQQKDKQGEQPQDGEGEKPQDKKEGDLKNNPAPGGESDQPEQSDEQREAAEEALAAAEGRMTESQAKQLLDSLKGEDVRVQLLDPRDNRNRDRPLRDW